MASTFGGLEIGKRSLFAARSAMTTVGHNIANANTEGYTRQRAIMKATEAYPTPSMSMGTAPGQTGTGVEVTTINRLREEFLDKQFRTENNGLGYQEGKANTFEMIENVMNETSEGGLQTTLDQFWQSWQDLTKQPEDSSTREVVLNRAVSMTDSFREMVGALDQIKEDLTFVKEDKLKETLFLANQISQVNQQISHIQPNGLSPNDLYDQRDLLIDKLSKLVDVKVTPDRSGMVNVQIGELALVTGKTSIGTDPALYAQVEEAATGGEIQALKEALGTSDSQGIIDGYIQKVDTLATEISKEINNLHRSGVNLDDLKNGVDYSTGERLPFFIDKDWYEANKDSFTSVPPNIASISSAPGPVDAKNMIVNPLLLKYNTKLAAAQPSANAVGDNGTALEIAKLKFKPMGSLLDGGTLDQFYRTTVSKLGMESSQAQRSLENQQVTTDAVDGRRQSVSGVSLDEEMTDMVKYQHAYNAASRSISAIDEMLEKLINGTGRVGL